MLLQLQAYTTPSDMLKQNALLGLCLTCCGRMICVHRCPRLIRSYDTITYSVREAWVRSMLPGLSCYVVRSGIHKLSRVTLQQMPVYYTSVATCNIKQLSGVTGFLRHATLTIKPFSRCIAGGRRPGHAAGQPHSTFTSIDCRYAELNNSRLPFTLSYIKVQNNKYITWLHC